MFNVKSFLFCVKQIFSIAISLENTIHTHTHIDRNGNKHTTAILAILNMKSEE